MLENFNGIRTRNIIDDTRLYYFNSNHVYHFNDDTVEEHNHMNSSFFKTPPQEKKLIIFPSYASHYVEPNNSDSDRISLSFNTKFIEQ